MEQILREQGYFVQEFLAVVLTEIPATLLYVGLVLGVGYAITWLLKRVPGINKLI